MYTLYILIELVVQVLHAGITIEYGADEAQGMLGNHFLHGLVIVDM